MGHSTAQRCSTPVELSYLIECEDAQEGSVLINKQTFPLSLYNTYVIVIGVENR